MVDFQAIAVISIVSTAFFSDIVCLILLIVFMLDPYSMPQGLDYCLLSLILSDLLHNFVLGTLSICSVVYGRWMFGNSACKLFACFGYAFWLVDIMSLFWLSVDRYVFITDVKYSTHKMRTKARFICKIVLSWFVSAVYSFAPIVAQKTGRYLKQSFVCISNSLNLESYYATVTVIIILPCFLGTNFNFARIFFMRFRYEYTSHRYESRLSEADVELLMDTNHKMSALLALIFWISWLPYIFYLLVGTANEPNPFEYWSGKLGAITRLPILTMCFPRYRNYICSFLVLIKPTASSPPRFKHFKETLSTRGSDEYILHI